MEFNSLGVVYQNTKREIFSTVGGCLAISRIHQRSYEMIHNNRLCIIPRVIVPFSMRVMNTLLVNLITQTHERPVALGSLTVHKLHNTMITRINDLHW